MSSQSLSWIPVTAIWHLDIHDLSLFGLLQLLFLCGLILTLVIILIDHADYLLQTWPVRNLHRVTSQNLLWARFRRQLSGRELEDAVQRAYYKCTKQGKPFAIKADLDYWMLMLPLESMKEWCNLPADHLSFMNYVENASAIGYHTNVDCQTHINAILAYNQKKHTDHVHSLILADADEFLHPFFGNPSSKEWTKFNPIEFVSNLMMHYATSLVLGPGFSRDPVLMQHITSHVLGIEEVINEFARWPKILFPFLWRLSPIHRKFRSNISVIRKKVVPEIKRRVQLLRLGEPTGEDMSMLTIFLKQALKEGLLSKVKNPKTDKKDIESLFMKTLFHIYEVWGPVTPLLSAMFVRCMADPEYIDVLREEISGSLESHEGWSSNILAHTPKLESFMRESLRLYAPISVSVSRRLNKPLRIESLNLNLPKGTCIGIPTKCVHGDPKNYPDPTRFDGYRFYDAHTNTCTTRASTASEKFLAFSYGTGLCPGRFIGVKVCEILLAKVLLNFDIEFISNEQEFPGYILLENTWSLVDTNLTAHVRSRK
ncbi:SirB protein [Nannizzia gypsea CBS 118893]|uniref:SirB protein n=1 Tax=Arthroderma gypseum (strain ATCC MYA-4604 / CBS 118893) TaxID=535722 RepID=E5QYE7_ARTGP|nr:SirB protein [Nannizzia gypsea CBS 118893]EFQ98023.1 SirB protein [Nannizzia gypsea CBS 118893]